MVANLLAARNLGIAHDRRAAVALQGWTATLRTDSTSRDSSLEMAGKATQASLA